MADFNNDIDKINQGDQFDNGQQIPSDDRKPKIPEGLMPNEVMDRLRRLTGKNNLSPDEVKKYLSDQNTIRQIYSMQPSPIELYGRLKMYTGKENISQQETVQYLNQPDILNKLYNIPEKKNYLTESGSLNNTLSTQSANSNQENKSYTLSDKLPQDDEQLKSPYDESLSIVKKISDRINRPDLYNRAIQGDVEAIKELNNSYKSQTIKPYTFNPYQPSKDAFAQYDRQTVMNQSLYSNNYKNELEKAAKVLIERKHIGEYIKENDFSLEKQKIIGEKIRRDISKIGFSTDEGMGNVSEQSDIVNYTKKRLNEILLKKKEIPPDIIDKASKESNKYLQEYEFSNLTAFYKGLFDNIDNRLIQLYNKNKDDIKQNNISNPEVIEYNNLLEKRKDIENSYYASINQFPEIKKLMERDIITNAYAQYIVNKFKQKTTGGKVLQTIGDIFSGYRLDEEEEYKGVAELTGMSVDEVKRIVKENRDYSRPDEGGFYVPSYLRRTLSEAGNIVGGIEQYLNRKLYSKVEADILNRKSKEQQIPLPKPLQFDINNVNTMTIMNTIASGLGQFVGFAATSALAENLISAPIALGSGLISGASETASIASKVASGVNKITQSSAANKRSFVRSV